MPPSPTPPPVYGAGSVVGDWHWFSTVDGSAYFYNSATAATVWEKPECFESEVELEQAYSQPELLTTCDSCGESSVAIMACGRCRFVSNCGKVDADSGDTSRSYSSKNEDQSAPGSAMGSEKESRDQVEISSSVSTTKSVIDGLATFTEDKEDENRLTVLTEKSGSLVAEFSPCPNPTLAIMLVTTPARNHLLFVDAVGPITLYTVLRALADAHKSRGWLPGLLGYFDTLEARPLRLVCLEMKRAVFDYPWCDVNTRIGGSLELWRQCFSKAVGANVSGRKDLVDKNFISLQNLLALDMSLCNQEGITYRAFRNLKGIVGLDISGCNQKGITDRAFRYIKGVLTLNMSGCNQEGITDSALVTGILQLDISLCKQLTNKFFASLHGIHTLIMRGCSNDISDAAFAHLAGITVLDISENSQPGITDAAFSHIAGIEELNLSNCNLESLTEGVLAHLTSVGTLNTSGFFNAAGLWRAPPPLVRTRQRYYFSIFNDFVAQIVPLTVTVALAGGGGPVTLLSVLAGAHSLGLGVLGHFNTREVRPLRVVCREMNKEVSRIAWCDLNTRIGGSLQLWRLSFPFAVGANISGREDLVDAHFEYLMNLRELNMSDCRKSHITDEAFRYLTGIRTLDMSDCGQETITDGAFVHLAGILELYMSWCNQNGITKRAFAHLNGIKVLDISDTGEGGITDGIFVYLAGIHTLKLSGSSLTITDEDVAHLAGIHTLDMEFSDQLSDVAFAYLAGIHTLKIREGGYSQLNEEKEITDAAFVHLAGIHTLDMSGCNKSSITDGAFDNLAGIHTLKMSGCNQEGITDQAFVHLSGIHTLNISGCTQITNEAFAHFAGIHTLKMRGKYYYPLNEVHEITDSAFAHLAGIHTLDMSGCKQLSITDGAFAHLAGIHTLKMRGCNQEGITDQAFVNLSGIHTLNMSGCTQITNEAFAHLAGIHTLDISGCTQITPAAIHLVGVHELTYTKSLCGALNL